MSSFRPARFTSKPAQVHQAPALPTPPPSQPVQEALSPGLARYRARRDAMNEIRLEMVLEALNGARRDKGKWRLGIGNIIFKGQRWQNANQPIKGYGGVSLVAHALQLKDSDALRWMEQKFSDVPDEDRVADGAWGTSEVESVFMPPDPAPASNWKVKEYLVQTRGLPPSLIQSEIDKGTIYAAHPTGKEGRLLTWLTNTIFLGPASAEIRSIGEDAFKGACAGSDPDTSGYRILHMPHIDDKAIVLTEAAIDGLSYHTLCPGRFVVSCNGAGSRFPLQYRLATEALDHGYGIHAAFDADAAGDQAASTLLGALYVRARLAEVFKIEEEVIDEWFLDGVIHVTANPSPHHLWINHPWQDAWPVAELASTRSEKGEVVLAWTLTDKRAPPQIELHVTRLVHPRLTKGVHVLPVTQEALARLTSDRRVWRDRPPTKKDWNEELIALGHGYIRTYERCIAEGGVTPPTLPPHLQDALHVRIPPQNAKDALVLPEEAASKVDAPPLRKIRSIPSSMPSTPLSSITPSSTIESSLPPSVSTSSQAPVTEESPTQPSPTKRRFRGP